MKFSDKVKYKYRQQSYGKKNKKKQQFDITKSLDDMESYLEKLLGKYTKKK
ncbi:hypothetical protein AN1V17_29410 [Vallitalea sediminicola]